MRALLLLLMGGIAGVVATVMFFSLDPDYSYTSAGQDGAGGGNARLSLDEGAFSVIVRDQLSQVETFGADLNVVSRIEPNGLIEVDVAVGVNPVGFRASMVLDPEVVESRLVLVVAEAHLGALAAPEEVARILERQLQAQLDSLAAGFDYRLTLITTTDGRLTLEIAI
jgi:hypothetical protein